jgi:hypothetical protein
LGGQKIGNNRVKLVGVGRLDPVAVLMASTEFQAHHETGNSVAFISKPNVTEFVYNSWRNTRYGAFRPK